MLCQVLYSSVTSGALGADQMRDLVEHARLRNALQSITGALIHFPSSRDLFQVLEGRRWDIDRLMRKIHANPRHCSIEVLYMSASNERSTTLSGMLAEDLPTTPRIIKAPFFVIQGRRHGNADIGSSAVCQRGESAEKTDPNRACGTLCVGHSSREIPRRRSLSRCGPLP